MVVNKKINKVIQFDEIDWIDVKIKANKYFYEILKQNNEIIILENDRKRIKYTDKLHNFLLMLDDIDIYKKFYNFAIKQLFKIGEDLYVYFVRYLEEFY